MNRLLRGMAVAASGVAFVGGGAGANYLRVESAVSDHLKSAETYESQTRHLRQLALKSAFGIPPQINASIKENKDQAKDNREDAQTIKDLNLELGGALGMTVWVLGVVVTQSLVEERRRRR